MRTVNRILAVSDIHGEHSKFLKLLENAESREEIYLTLLNKFLSKKDLSWNGLSEWLFDWGKLQKSIDRF